MAKNKIEPTDEAKVTEAVSAAPAEPDIAVLVTKVPVAEETAPIVEPLSLAHRLERAADTAERDGRKRVAATLHGLASKLGEFRTQAHAAADHGDPEAAALIDEARRIS